MSCQVVDYLQFFLQVLLLEVLGDHNLVHSLSSNIGSQFGETLFAAASHTDEQGGGTLHLDDSGDLEQVLDGVVEEHQVHLLGRVLLVVLIQEEAAPILQFLRVIDCLVDLLSVLLDVALFIDSVFP